MSLAPIALFVYNRPEHTHSTFNALIKNKYAAESELFIFSDGAKSEKHIDKVREVRQLIKSFVGFKKIRIIESDRNRGLAESIIMGVTDLISKYGKIIVLEDDMVTSPFFLSYLNEALDKYENNDHVVSIHAYRLPINETTPETYFLRGADCWGWATWKRGWDIFETSGQKLLNSLNYRRLNYDFDLEGSYPYTQLLKDQIVGKNDSWAIRWHAAAFLADKLTLYPARSLVFNIGLDTSGTHCEATDEFNVELSQIPIQLEDIEILESIKVRNSFREHFRNLYWSRRRRLLEVVRRLVYVLRNQGIILFLNRIIRKFINRSEHFSESFFSWHLANLHADIVADKLGVKNRLEYIHEILEKERFEVLKYSEIANEFFMLLQKVEKAEIIEVGNSDKSLKDFIAPDSETSRDIKNWLTIPLADFYEQDWLNFKNGIYKYCSESAKDNKEVKTLRILVIHDSIFYTAEPFLIFEAFSKCDFSHIFFMGFYESQMKENVLTVRQNFNTNLIAPIWALKSLEVFQDIMKLTKRKYELRFQGTLGQFNGSAEVVRNSYWFQSQ